MHQNFLRSFVAFMKDNPPSIRKDLEFFPVQHAGRQMVLIRDHLELVPKGKVVDLSVYRLLTLLDGIKTVRDLQMDMMRQKGGLLVGSDEVESLLENLDTLYLLDTEKFRSAREEIVAGFASEKLRTCFLCGQSYPEDPTELTKTLDSIMADLPENITPEGTIEAIVAPHIDFSAGSKAYAAAYQMLQYVSPCRVVVLGVGHRMVKGLFCLTEKDFATPLGVVKNEPALIRTLKEAAGDGVAGDDFAHRSEHSIEFQVLFLQHLLGTDAFTILPILCGSLQGNLPEYNRQAFLEKAGPFLESLKHIVSTADKDTLILAGVDFSHIGLKFGHQHPADYLESRAKMHDQKLLEHLSNADVEDFWEESKSMQDQYNVCGFSALACLLEILPPCRGRVLDYQTHHEAATKSAVSFAAVVFTS